MYLYTCMYVCMYVCMYTDVYMYIYTYIHVYVYTLTTTQITRQHDIISFFSRNGQWADSLEWWPMDWLRNWACMGKLLRIACKECRFKEPCVLTSFTPTEIPLSPHSPPLSLCCLKYPSPESCPNAQRRRPEPTMTNWGNASKTWSGIPHDTAEHNKRKLVAFCQGC